ncbi:hypothetical protein IAG44_35745 [Streptomyces roseirectus]|uniref:Uncharacterized protein n=1 Tax=Streptomyces roseirectus TaxID=2768066 RepID=A0A7H0INB8_9ACTN|nr:hypothetical protein [Streptomyces roseirectus]QNP74284.1 hypothetical protein IAG44_35745 [Streptomyces roseirectus]
MELWTQEEFGESHGGYAGAVLPDGSEPKPVYLDFGSSAASIVETREWWAYDGRLSRPLTVGFRGACMCGWRGTAYPVDRAGMSYDDLADVDVLPAYEDWGEHIEAVERRTIPVPEEVSDTIDRLHLQLANLADQAPVAALRAIGELERLTQSLAYEAAYSIKDDEPEWETIGVALGLDADRARRLTLRYLLRSHG